MDFNEVDKAPPDAMDEMIAFDAYDYQRPKRGEVRTGTILSTSPDQIIIDIGVKREALISSRELERMSAEDLEKLTVGGEVPVYVVKPEDKEGNLIVSIHLAQLEQDWVKAQQLWESKGIWEAPVSGYNKGGLVVPFGKIRAFIPASQISDFPRSPSPEQKASQLASYVGQSLPVRVIEVDRQRKRLILSQRSAQREWREKQRERLIEALREGDEIQGTVSSLTDFGAFVDIGGIDGLVHISELAWHRVKHPRELLKVGDEIRVYILRLDRERKRIGLSLKRLQPDPWTLMEDKYSVDQLVECMITNVTDFGAFARFKEGVEGLIHASELTDEEGIHPSALVKHGDELLALIIKIDVQRQRIGLSLKQVPENELREWLARRAALAEAEAETAEEVLAEEEEAAIEVPADVEAEAGEEVPAGEKVEPVAAGPGGEVPADVEAEAGEEVPAGEKVEPVAAGPGGEVPADVEAEAGEEVPAGEKVETVAAGPGGVEAQARTDTGDSDAI
jgi:small subunit ribosomal protein S1